MLLDNLLAKLDVQFEPFSVCLIGSGWSLRLPSSPTAMLHFVLKGKGVLKSADGNEQHLGPCSLAVVPKGSAHALASEGRSGHEHRIDPSSDTAWGTGVITAGGGDESIGLRRELRRRFRYSADDHGASNSPGARPAPPRAEQ